MENMDSKQTVGLKKQKKKYTLEEKLALIFDVLFPWLILIISNISNPGYYGVREIYLRTIPFDLLIDIVVIKFLFEITLLIGFSLLFKAIFKKSLRKNIALSILFQIISIISFFKMEVVQKPFLPTDLSLIGNTFEIIGYGNLNFIQVGIIQQLFVNIVLLIVQGIITKQTHYEKVISGRKRIISFIIAVIILNISFFGNVDHYLYDDDFESRYNYYRYGAVVEFFKNMKDIFYRTQCDIYNEERLDQIKQDVEKIPQNEVSLSEQPNIIVIMSESLSDPTRLKGVTLNQDPISNYRNLSKNYANGNTVVDVYGGETCISEFEFLMSNTNKFLQYEKYPYNQIVNRNMLSIPRILSDQGYDTIAIHPNDSGFYDRKNGWIHLGFDKLIFDDDYHQIQNIYNELVSDIDTANEIIYQYENSEADKKFIFAVTIEAHASYGIDKYNNYNVDIKESNYTEETNNQLKSYSQSIYNFDQSLQHLVEYFSKKEEPVMIVTFGDHLPALNEIYNEEYQENIERYETPYVIWTNYDKEIEDKEELSISALSMYVLENANISLPWEYRYIENFCKEYPVYTKRYVIDKYGNNCDTNMSNQLIDNYQIIQYYLMFKKKL